MNSNFRIVEADGLLDGNRATQVRREISECLKDGAKIILLDLKEVTFIDSSGLGALVSALKIVRTSGAQLYICSVCDQVKILFELTSMNRVFDVFASREEFQNQVLPKLK